MSETKRSLIVAGVTTRALAVSAARAGWQVTAVDAFGDRDLRAVAAVLTVPKSSASRFTPVAAARIARAVSAGRRRVHLELRESSGCGRHAVRESAAAGE